MLLQPPPANTPSVTIEALQVALTAGALSAAFLVGVFRAVTGLRKRRTDENKVVIDRAATAARYAMERATEERERADELLTLKFELERQLAECDEQRQAYAIRLKMLGQDTDPDTGQLLPVED